MPSMITALLRTHVFRAAHLVAVLNALRGYYVLAGSEPTISQKSEGADMSVDVSAFSYAIANVSGSKGTSSNVAIDAADGTNPRIDLLYLNSSGTLTISKGTAAAKSPSAETNWLKYEAPYPADFSAVDGVLLAEIHVGAGVTTITDANIRNISVPRKPGIEADGSVAMTSALTMTQISTPSEPASSKTAIYPKSDGKLYYYPNGGEETEVGSGSGGLWSDMPEEVTRVSDTSFSMPDTSNANSYDKMFGPGTVIKWEKSGGGVQFAKITGASYGTDTVTITIVGNTLAAAFTDMKYCIHRAEQEVFIIPGTLPGNTATADIAKTRHIRGDIYVFSAKIWYKTAPTTTKGVWDINDDGTTIFTTKPEVAASATEGVEQVSDCLAGTALTAVADKSLITVDYDSGHATTPGADAYVYLFWMPVAWRYMS